MIDAILKIHATFVFPLFVLMMILTIWGMIDTVFIIRLQGKMKRGIRLFERPLPETTKQFLQALPTDVVVKRKMMLGEATVGFIRVQGNERLMQTRKPRWRTSWPYLVYVDLNEPAPMLEYRASLPMSLIFVLWFLITIPVPFLWLFLTGMIYLNYYMETKAIEEFLQQQQEKYQAGTVL